MSSEYQVHVVSKENIANHAVVSASKAALPPVDDGHVRVRTIIISLTINTQTYARLGGVRNWWDTYPVSHDLPEPYNDRSRYGICPAWGYGEVLDSKVSGISTGELLWGFWPSSSLPVELRLVPAGVTGHWIEKSEGRQSLMNLYQRYVIAEPGLRIQSLDEAQWKEMALGAVFTVWQAGYLLNAYVFGSRSTHPLGIGEWSKEDTDLSSAVVVALSASGKTARGFIHHLKHDRSSDEGPLGLLSITAARIKTFVPESSLPAKTVAYEDATGKETMDWMISQRPRKVVVVDFGGRGNSLYTLLGALKTNLSDVKVVVIGVGGAADALTPKDVGAWAQQTATLENRVQMNTSGLRDTAMDRYGEEAYFNAYENAWQSFVKSPAISDLKLEIREGIAGDNGFEGGWTQLCEGQVPGDVALVYRL